MRVDASPVPCVAITVRPRCLCMPRCAAVAGGPVVKPVISICLRALSYYNTAQMAASSALQCRLE